MLKNDLTKNIVRKLKKFIFDMYKSGCLFQNVVYLFQNSKRIFVFT